MKLRWTNEKNLAMTFEANDISSFREHGLSALRSLRIATERRVHRGEIHKNVSWFDTATLHAFDEIRRQWVNLGLKKKHSFQTLGTIAYFDPQTVRVPNHEADNLELMISQDELWLVANAPSIWQMCVDTWQWSSDLNTQLMNVEDALRKLTDDEKSE